jgi:hypothetical protein
MILVIFLKLKKEGDIMTINWFESDKSSMRREEGLGEGEQCIGEEFTFKSFLDWT